LSRRFEKIGRSMIVYDDSVVSQMTEELFDYATWPEADQAPGYSGGRGATLFIEHEGDPWVLRHYHRGGKIGHLLQDQFAFLGSTKTRPLLEYDLLDYMYGRGLPSPQPVAARFVRRGVYYTADLITRRLPDVEPLSNRLCKAPLEMVVWERIGRCVGRFHAANIFHADLTAHNLQISSQDEIFLLDFDRGRVMPGAGKWRDQNLMRLQRSFLKVSGDGSIAFDDEHWEQLMAGYQKGLAI